MALECLVRRNMDQMRRKRFAPLYASGVRYKREPKGQSNWQTTAELYASREGDCEDIACHLVAELKMTGKDPRARIDLKGGGKPGLFHIFVRRGDGSSEDPCKRLGM